MFERFTDRARRVLVLAQESARLLGHDNIGTEHLLLGLIEEKEALAAKALESLGVSREALREKLEEMVPPTGSPPTGSPPFTPRAKKALELSLREALQLGDDYIGTEHILLGLIREGEGAAAKVLLSLGVDFSRALERVIEMQGGEKDERGATAAAVRSPAPGPRRGRCESSLVETARYRTVEVRPGEGEPGSTPMSVAMTYCGRCGTVLGAVTGVDWSRPPRPRASMVGSVAPKMATRRDRDFPDDLLDPVLLDRVPDAARVELTYRDHNLVVGHLGGIAIHAELTVPSHSGTATGTFAGAGLRASWQVDDNSTAHRGSSAALDGELAGRGFHLRGRFVLQPGLLFDRGVVAGELGGESVVARVTTAEGGLDSTSTVAVHGTVGVTDLELFASLGGDLTHGIVRGTLGDRPVGLDAAREESSSTVRITGAYEGPPALLAVIVGVLVYFM